MAKKKVGVKIEEDLHAAVKSEAPNRKMLLEDAYEQALQCWLAGTPASSGSTENPLFPKSPQPSTIASSRPGAEVRANLIKLTEKQRNIAEEIRQLLESEADIGTRSGSTPARPRKRGNG